MAYAAEAAGDLDCLALSHLDQALSLVANDECRVCQSYIWPDRLDTMPSDLFRHDADHRITGLKLGPAEDLNRQNQLTQALSRVKPVFETVSSDHWTDSLKKIISRAVGRPIRYLSYGPTHVDRTGR